MTVQIIPDTMITVPEAARRCDRYPYQLYRMIEEGRLPAYRTPLGLLVDEMEVERLRSELGPVRRYRRQRKAEAARDDK